MIGYAVIARTLFPPLPAFAPSRLGLVQAPDLRLMDGGRPAPRRARRWDSGRGEEMNRQEAMEILRLYRNWTDQKPLNDDEETVIKARKEAIKRAYAVLTGDEAGTTPSVEATENEGESESEMDMEREKERERERERENAVKKAYVDGFNAGAEQMRRRAAAVAADATDQDFAVRTIRELSLNESEAGTESA
jgi:hypothetical protein